MDHVLKPCHVLNWHLKLWSISSGGWPPWNKICSNIYIFSQVVDALKDWNACAFYLIWLDFIISMILIFILTSLKCWSLPSLSTHFFFNSPYLKLVLFFFFFFYFTLRHFSVLLKQKPQRMIYYCFTYSSAMTTRMTLIQ